MKISRAAFRKLETIFAISFIDLKRFIITFSGNYQEALFALYIIAIVTSVWAILSGFLAVFRKGRVFEILFEVFVCITSKFTFDFNAYMNENLNNKDLIIKGLYLISCTMNNCNLFIW